VTLSAPDYIRLRAINEWVARLADAKRQNSLDAELRRLSFVR
jgi:hypothetical protein